MDIKKVLFCFLLGLPICVTARVLQLTKAIDYENGFFISEKEVYGYIMLLVIAVICALVAVVSFKAGKLPSKPPKTSWLTALSAGFISGRLFVELFGEVMSFAMPAWQVLVVKFVTVITAIYFLIILLQGFLKFRLPSAIHIIPAVYAVIKTIFTFINISALSVISDNILLMASYCLLMLFFINYARLYNGVSNDKTNRKMLAWGLVSAVTCITASLPTLIINIFSETPYLHSNISVINTLFTIGCFVVIFLCEYFYKKEEHI